MGSTVNEPVLRVGVVGVGVISQQYFEHFPALPGLSLVAVADLDVDRAQTVGAAQGVRGTSVDELLAADEIFSTGNHGKVVPCLRYESRTLAAGPIYRQARELYWAFAHRRTAVPAATRA